MGEAPSPSSGSKGFFQSASFRKRPLFIRRNAWMGNWKEENGDVKMAITAQPAAAENQPELVAMTQRIDVSATQEKRPKKRARLAHASSVLNRSSKFVFVCILSI
jgi:hypothetical protein